MGSLRASRTARVPRWMEVVVLAFLVISCFLTGQSRADASFESVRTRLTEDHSNKATDPEGKYFPTSWFKFDNDDMNASKLTCGRFHQRYDGRFGEKELTPKQLAPAATNLMRSYLSAMEELHVETWLMHETLLGWWWGGKVLPWGTNLTAYVGYSDLHFLASYHNMTVRHVKSETHGKGSDFLLEISPRWSTFDEDDATAAQDTVDARWIDVANGLFIDIFTLYATDDDRMLKCKDGTDYEEVNVFPLRTSEFEGRPVRIPAAYAKLLSMEYSESDLKSDNRPKSVQSSHVASLWNNRKNANVFFKSHFFDQSKQKWLMVG